jgi:hypothetical protein
MDPVTPTIILRDIPDIMRAVALRLHRDRARLTLEGANYPPRNDVPSSPWAMVRQSLRIPAIYEKARYGRQEVSVPIDIVVLVTAEQDNQRDAARLDPVISPILDTFDVSRTGGAAIRTLPDLQETDTAKLRQIWNQARVERGPLKWGTQHCHAALIRLDVVFQRTPED